MRIDFLGVTVHRAILGPTAAATRAVSVALPAQRGRSAGLACAPPAAGGTWQRAMRTGIGSRPHLGSVPLSTARCQASRVIIRQAPSAVHTTIHATMTQTAQVVDSERK